MNIVVAQISEDNGLRVHHLYPDGELGPSSGDGCKIGQTEVSLQANREGEKVALVGSVSAAVEFECDRCLAALSVPVDESFDLVYVPPFGTGDEHELGEEDLSLGFYQDGVISVDDLTREQIELALPMSRLCTEECRGLCAECGENLNHAECACIGGVDTRWAALKELKSN